MNIEQFERERTLTEIIAERDLMILQLIRQNQQLQSQLQSKEAADVPNKP